MGWSRGREPASGKGPNDFSWSDVLAMIIAAFWVFLPYVVGLVVIGLAIVGLLRLWAR